MAHMICCATDFTYDLFVEDMEKYTATPIKGVHCRADADERERFARHLKNMVRDYRAEWSEISKGLYSNEYGWIGDRFAERLWHSNFSDMYKDVYGQRPHLDTWYYVHALGLPTIQDIPRTFCATPVEDAVARAKEVSNTY